MLAITLKCQKCMYILFCIYRCVYTNGRFKCCSEISSWQHFWHLFDKDGKLQHLVLGTPSMTDSKSDFINADCMTGDDIKGMIE